MKFYQIAEKEGEAFNYDRSKMRHLIENLRDGRYLISFQELNPQSSVKEYRRCYFAKIDGLRFDSGEDRYSLHEIVKENILAPMYDELPELFEDGSELSTKLLTLEGWPVLLERLDLWAFIEYGAILQ
jgi:hypothetical protein